MTTCHLSMLACATAGFLFATGTAAQAQQGKTNMQTLPAPTLTSPPSVTAASGEGLMPGISDHMAVGPTLYKLDAQLVEQISPLIQRQFLHGTQSTFVKWTAKAGGVVPLHHHANEQMTWIVEGEAEVFSQGKKYVVGAGEIIIFPPNVPHEFRFTKDTIDIDFFAPGRQDWMDGTANYYAK